LTITDIEALKPFHWGYHFDQVMEIKGGFDAIITNPPWETFKPDAKEFFAQHSDLVTKKKMNIKEFKKARNNLLKDTEIANSWLEYQSQYPHISNYYRSSSQYRNQISIVNGRKAGTDINLYKLFLEQCFNLLNCTGNCGIIVPSGIYTDLGSKQLREMLFSQTQVTSLYSLSNEKFIFDAVHHAFKFTILTFEKGQTTNSFSAAFRINPREAIKADQLTNFFFADDAHVQIATSLIRKLSPDSLSIMEFRDDRDIKISQKLVQFPLLGREIKNRWNLTLCNEFHMTGDSDLYHLNKSENMLPLREGKSFHQFMSAWSEPKYWLHEEAARNRLLAIRKKQIKRIQKNQEIDTDNTLDISLDYKSYRLAFRDVSASTNERSMIMTVLPPNVFCPHTVSLEKVFDAKLIDAKLEINHKGIRNNFERLYLCSLMNSFVIDYFLRQRITSHLSFFFIYSTPIPRLIGGDFYFSEIVERSAKLICVTSEFDDLAAEVGLGSHINGVTDESERAQLRAELDGMIAHLYGLTEAELTHILRTFPLVPEETKQAALEEYRKFAPLAGDQEIIDLINRGESAKLEFKSTARWDLREDKKSKVIEEIILKTVAAFLNTDGGTLLIGVADDGSIVGLQPDMQTLRKKDRDGYELWLMNDLLLATFGNAMAPFFEVSFGLVDGKDVCRVNVKPGPEPVYITTKALNPGGQPQECFFIRTGNSTNKLDRPSEIAKYLSQRWQNLVS
jgi:hypothetical protein